MEYAIAIYLLCGFIASICFIYKTKGIDIEARINGTILTFFMPFMFFALLSLLDEKNS